MPDIFDEVEEDLRAERAKKLLQRYGSTLFAAALAVVVAVGGFQLWRWHQARETARVATQFLAAMHTADGPPGDARKAALPGFAMVAAEGGAGYRTLARLREAALKADAGDMDGAQALWGQVIADSGADPLLRDLARLQSAQRQIDTGDPKTLEDRLKPLTVAGNPWRPLAEEAVAMLQLRQGNRDAAKDAFRHLAQDTNAPDGVRARANGLLQRLGG